MRAFGDASVWRYKNLKMRTFVDAVANFIPDELTLFLLVVFDREVVSTTTICSRLVVRPIKESPVVSTTHVGMPG